MGGNAGGDGGGLSREERLTRSELTMLASLVQWRVNMLMVQALISEQAKAQRDKLERLLWKLDKIRR